MNKHRKIIAQNAIKLKNSQKTLSDIYKLIFSYSDTVMVECSTMTRKITFTYSQIEQRIEKISKSIAGKIPEHSCFIGLHGENSPEWIITFWAILKSGNKPYLVNLRQPKTFTEGVLNTLGVSCVITCNSNAEYTVPTLTFESLENNEFESDITDRTFANEFALSTSGTTLKEKICLYNGTVLSEQILNLETIIRTNPNIIGTRNGSMKMLAFLPLYHIFGLEAMFLWYAFMGSTFVFLNDFSPENILRTIRNHNVTHVFSVPLLWHAVEKAVRREVAQKDEKTQKKFQNGLELSLKIQNSFPILGSKIAASLFKDVRKKLLGENIRCCISGGSFIKPSAVELLNAIGYPLCNGYGMTEIGICSVELGKKPSERMLCSIGKPFDSLEYRIGEKGQLLAKGSSLCKEIIIDGVKQNNSEWFDTGDIVHIDEHGRYYIDGRYSDVVFSDDGENLNPDFAERAFSLRDALELSVLGNDDNTKLMLVVRVPRGLLAEQKERLISEIERCNTSLPSSYSVREIRYTYDPLIEEGGIKVSRAYLKKAIKDNKIKLFDICENDKPTDSANDSELKYIIRGIFAKVLELPVEKIGDEMHFMNDLGGTSLDYFTLVNELDTRFDLKIDFGSDYDAEHFGYTVNHFERLIKELIK